MGFMGSIPIAGVIWQHIHYIVGLQQLGHDVYYIEDSARLPYNPDTFEVNEEFDYAAKVLGRMARDFGFENRWGYCARFLPDHPTAGISLKKIRELYRDADAILNICGAQEFNHDLLQSDRILYVESDPGVEQIKIDNRLFERSPRAFHVRRTCRYEKISSADARFEMDANASARCDKTLENESRTIEGRCIHLGGQLVDERLERYHLAWREISLEQVARVSAFCCRTEKIWRNV